MELNEKIKHWYFYFDTKRAFASYLKIKQTELRAKFRELGLPDYVNDTRVRSPQKSIYDMIDTEKPIPEAWIKKVCK